MTSTTTIGRMRGLGVMTVAALAIAALGGSVLAQSPAPSATTTPTTPGTTTRVPGCGPWATRDGRARGDGRAHRGQLGGWARRGPMWRGERGTRRGAGRWQPPNRQRQTLPGFASRRVLVRVATVRGVEGGSITLVTADGWARTIDATTLTITRAGSPVTIAELPVGTRVRVAERRADDGTWQVTRLAVVLAGARGTVTSVTTDGFQLARGDGADLAVRTSDATTWLTGCQPGGDLASLEVGAVVVVRGVAAPDGSIDATTVSVAPGRQGARRQRDRRAPFPFATPASVASPAPTVPSA